MNSQYLNFIRITPPFDCLNETELALIETTVELKDVSASNHILVQGGDSSRYLYLIYDGAVRSVRDGQVFQVYEDGELFGFSSLLNQNSPTADLIAEENTSLLCIPADTFRILIDNVPFVEFFLKDLSERLRQTLTSDATNLSGDLMTPIGDLIVRSPVMVQSSATVAEAARAMRENRTGSALVQGQALGIVTDRDFRSRLLAEGLGPETPVSQIMSSPIKTVEAELPVYGALLFMLEKGIRHLPLTQDGEVIGIITADDILRHQAKSPFYFLRQLEKMDTPEALSRYALEIAGMVEMLYRGGLDVAQIGRMIASLNDALLRRLLHQAEAELGPPPTPYAWIVFGSEGRMEQALLTDQDNALVYLEDSEAAKIYFVKLAEMIINGLIQAGFPPCPGGYMATNWCLSRASWEKMFRRWIQQPEPQAVLDAAVFFDFRAIHGELSVESLEQIVVEAGDNGVFMGLLTRSALDFNPPLGFFRRIRVEEDGQVDLKAGGIAPIVSLARIYALKAKSRARSTFERLEAAQEAGVLSQEGAETLAQTYRFLFQLRLRDQLAAFEANQAPNNKIHLDALSSVEKRNLKEAFMAIRELQDSVSHGLVG